jgi:cold shock CspA family protein
MLIEIFQRVSSLSLLPELLKAVIFLTWQHIRDNPGLIHQVGKLYLIELEALSYSGVAKGCPIELREFSSQIEKVGGEDVFISARTLERVGVGSLEPNQRVRLQVRQGHKGPMAEGIEPI